MSNYSQIISAENYNRILTEEHLYIAQSDHYIYDYISEKAKDKLQRIVELGCGPARILRNISKINNINLTALDVDKNFLAYAQEVTKGLGVELIECSIENYNPKEKIDIFYSQGVHHHIPKGKTTYTYLNNIYNHLYADGIYILSDEFIPNYEDELGREIKLTIWYAHIIADAIENGFEYLAREEAKTYLDDIQEGRSIKSIKTKDQIEIVLSKVTEINNLGLANDLVGAEKKASELLEKLNILYNINPSQDLTLDLSRQDYKISHEVLKTEIEKVGFKIIECKAFGPIETIGAMVVYILAK